MKCHKCDKELVQIWGMSNPPTFKGYETCCGNTMSMANVSRVFVANHGKEAMEAIR